METLVIAMSTLTQKLMAESIGQGPENNSSDEELMMEFANGTITALPTVLEMDKYTPSAKRCGDCVISHALIVVRDGGAI